MKDPASQDIGSWAVPRPWQDWPALNYQVPQIIFTQENSITSYVRQKWTSQLSRRTYYINILTPWTNPISIDYCVCNWFRRLSINWNCPDNWFRRLSINWNCPDIDIGDCLLIGIVQTVDFGDCLLIGIVQTIDFGDCLLIGIVQTIYFGDCLSIGIIQTIDFGDHLLIGIV